MITDRELEALGAVHRHQPDARVLGALGLVHLGQQRQAIDEAARATVPARGLRTRARPTPVRRGSRSRPRLPRCAPRAGPGGSRDWSSILPMATDTGSAARHLGRATDQVAERRQRRRRAAGEAPRVEAADDASPRASGAARRARRAAKSGDAGQQRRPSGRRRGAASSASITPLPMPRAGTLTTRRRLTSSCGLMTSPGRRARP